MSDEQIKSMSKFEIILLLRNAGFIIDLTIAIQIFIREGGGGGKCGLAEFQI